MSDALTVSRLVKRYAGRAVVDELTFAVPAGSIFALLGPNGAGKTTTVEILEGYRRPDGGEVRVLGLDPIRDRAALAPRVGVMLQEGGAYQAATPAELLALYARFYARPWQVGDLLAQVGLDGVARQRVRTLSGGQRQRLNLALALVGQPEVLILDEPTAGMDPQARQAAWALFRRLRDAGTTVLLTTHAMDEAERLADLVAVIDAGRLLALDTPTSLVAAASAERVVVTTPARIDPADLARDLGAAVTAETTSRYVVAAGATAIPAISAWFAARNLSLTAITAAEGNLEDVFLRLTGREVRSLTGPRVAAQAGMELRLTLRNGEALLVTFAIPLLVLVFFGLVDALPIERAFLVPGVLALSVMSTSLVALGIATGFERHYLVLKRLGATPLTRAELITAKIAAVLAIEVVQTIVLLGVAALVLGYRPGPGSALWLVPVALLLGTAAFAGIGLALAGSLRATATLALANATYVVLMLIGGVIIPLDRLPAALAIPARLLPSAALAALYRAALGAGDPAWALDLPILGAWAIAAVLLATRVFRWE